MLNFSLRQITHTDCSLDYIEEMQDLHYPSDSFTLHRGHYLTVENKLELDN